VLRDPRIGAEVLVGAAGGGSIDTSGGAVAQPMAFVDYGLASDLSLRLSAGRIVSTSGGLNTAVLDLAINFDYGAIGR